MYQFRMCGRKVEVYHYQVNYSEQGTETDITVAYCPTLAEAQAMAERTGGTVTELDCSDYEWMDGIEVADVSDTYSEAAKIYDMGQDAYQRRLAFERSTTAEQLRADLDYVMLMGGL